MGSSIKYKTSEGSWFCVVLSFAFLIASAVIGASSQGNQTGSENINPTPFEPTRVSLDAALVVEVEVPAAAIITSIVEADYPAAIAAPTPAPCNRNVQGMPLDAVAARGGTSLVEGENLAAAVPTPTPAPYNRTPQGMPLDAMNAMNAARVRIPSTSLVEGDNPAAAVAAPTPTPYNRTPQGMPLDAMNAMNAARVQIPSTSLVEGENPAAALAAPTPIRVAPVDCPVPVPAVTPCPALAAEDVLQVAQHGQGNLRAIPGAPSAGPSAGPGPPEPTHHARLLSALERGSSGVNHSEL